jgi:hypothetical protein
MNDWEDYERMLRRRAQRDRLIGCVVMTFSAILMVLVMWAAYIGIVAVFG